MVKECMGVFGRLFGHKFNPRFSVVEHEITYKDDFYRSMALLSNGRSAIIRVEERYEGEVCERCGEPKPK